MGLTSPHSRHLLSASSTASGGWALASTGKHQLQERVPLRCGKWRESIEGDPVPEITHSLGRLAAYIRDCRIPLELCPTSNVNTGVVSSIAEHPIGLLGRLRFRVTLNTDNRLMSDTSMTREMAQLEEAFGWDLDDFEWITVNAMKSAFASFPERLRLINGVIKPRYSMLRSEQSLGGS